MEIIPVIDLRDAAVVRARLGRRDEYLPIQTRLSSTSDPVDVARGLLSVHPFRTLYVADLDAIEGKRENHASLARLKSAFPDLAFWVDNGILDLGAARTWLASRLGHLVLGSETQVDDTLVREMAHEERIVLSLDFRGDAFQGPPELLANPRAWPRRIIAMTLARVGSGAGPDMEKLAALRLVAPDRRLYAAGGVRDLADIERLARANIAGALVASALHDGRLTAGDIARIVKRELR
jgi:phosphoribosylformimino-5-aminoimidazole carboxamide ribotide isomerase